MRQDLFFKLSDFLTIYRTNTKKIKELEEKISQGEEQLQQLEDSIEKVEGEIKKERKELKELEEEIDKLEKELKKLNEADYRTFSSPEELSKKISQVEEKLDEKSTIYLEKEEKLENLKEKLEKLKKELEEFESNWKIDKEKYLSQITVYKNLADTAKKNYKDYLTKLDGIAKKEWEKIKKLKKPAVLVKEGKCSYCGHPVSRAELERLGDGNRIVHCNKCMRILVLKRQEG